MGECLISKLVPFTVSKVVDSSDKLAADYYTRCRLGVNITMASGMGLTGDETLGTFSRPEVPTMRTHPILDPLTLRVK